MSNFTAKPPAFNLQVIFLYPLVPSEDGGWWPLCIVRARLLHTVTARPQQPLWIGERPQPPRHPLLVADDDVGGVQVHQALRRLLRLMTQQQVIAEVAKQPRPTAPWGAVGRQNGQNIMIIHSGLLQKTYHHFQPLDDPGLL